MIANPSIAIFLGGLDSLFIGIAFGTGSPSRLWIRLAAALGTADGLAAHLGALSGDVWPAWVSACVPVILTVYAFSVLLAAPRMRELLTTPVGMAVLPLALKSRQFSRRCRFSYRRNSDRGVEDGCGFVPVGLCRLRPRERGRSRVAEVCSALCGHRSARRCGRDEPRLTQGVPPCRLTF